MTDRQDLRKAILDGHVHVHSVYEIDEFLDTAYANLQRAERELGISNAEFCLLFTECAGDDYFGALGEFPLVKGMRPNKHIRPSRWKLESLPEPESLRAISGERKLTIVSGCQIAAKEGLEVLLLGTRQRIKDGLPIREVLEMSRDLEVPHIIPWGAGKWFFARGKLLSALMEECRGSGFFLGDEGGRPWLWPRPNHIRKGEQEGVFDLPGTDPLPFSHDLAKVGRMGFALDIELDEDGPAASIRRTLLRLDTQPRRFVTHEPLFRFVRNQFAMQLRKHDIWYQNG